MSRKTFQTKSGSFVRISDDANVILFAPENGLGMRVVVDLSAADLQRVGCESLEETYFERFDNPDDVRARFISFSQADAEAVVADTIVKFTPAIKA